MAKKKPAARAAQKAVKASKKPKKKPVSTRKPARSVARKPAAPSAKPAVAGKPTARALAVQAAGAGKRPQAAPLRPAKKPKSPFKKRELDAFRASLLDLRHARIGDKESREKEALKAAGQDVSVDHMADFGSDSYEQEFTLGLLEQDIETLRDIHDALLRIQEGTFGLCEECEEPVAKARLKAIPHARLCVPCKMKEE